MSEEKVLVKTYAGSIVGYFLNPTIREVAVDHFQIIGSFFESDGSKNDRIPYNPEALPYSIEFQSKPDCKGMKLVQVYVDRGRQPVKMHGISREAKY